MRIRRLRLIAFGHFTGVDLELGEAPALHLIYGPNEAGKSTALRAISGLLYGIPPTTGDAHLHAMRDLRVGAELTHGGDVLSLVRRKGNVRTLLDADGQAIAETALTAMLGGVDEATFGSMFGLNHETLRSGAKALLDGRGSVGESLFDAGLGGRGIQSVLDELRAEADELYRPRGQRQAVNDALRRCKEAKERRASESLRPDAWVAQVEALEQAGAEHRAASDSRRALKIEESALQRALRVMPLLSQRRDLSERRGALGDVVILPAEAAARRLAVQRLLDDCGRDTERLTAEVEKLGADLDALKVAEPLAALDAEAVEAIHMRLGEYRKARLDLPKRGAELKAREAEVARLAAHVGLTGSATDLERARLGVRAQAAVRRLARSRAELDAIAGDIRERLEQRRAELAGLRQRAEELPAPPDDAALRAAVDEARMVADLPERIDELDAEMTALRQSLEGGVQRLAPWRGEAEALARAVLPSPESVDRFAREMDRLAAARGEIERRRRDLEERSAENQRDRAAVEAMGTPPNQSELAAARRRRDELWTRVRAEPAAVEQLGAELERALADADEIADRLYREADRVGSAARLRADAELMERQLQSLERESTALASEGAELSRRWREAWDEIGFAPAAPAEMRDWLGRSAAVLRDLELLRQRAAERQRLAERLAERSAALAAAMQGAGAAARDDRADPGDPGHGFADLLRQARELCEAWTVARRQRDELARSIAALESEVARDARALETRSAQIDAWRSEWRNAVAPLGLDADVATEEALAVLDAMVALAARVEDTETMRARVAAIESDVESFRRDVERLVAAGGLERGLAGANAADAAERLVREHRQVVDDLRARRRIESEIAGRRDRLQAISEERRAAEAELQSLLAAAAAADLDGLVAAEKRSEQAVTLDAEIARIEKDLLAAGEGAAIADLAEQTRHIDGDSARARLYEIEGETQELSDEIDRLGQKIGSLKEGLARLENERGAATAAAEEQEALADLDAQVRRYVRVALAAEILAGEVERYRQENQGPILTRANVFFPRLTIGAYRELRVGYDVKDQEVLRCVRSDGAEVDVEALSDGTRDQLYLALRLATLDHFAESHEPLPLVLDDVFIHFDDRRTEAALEVLADFAATTQILLFTHHAHLVDLARRAVPDRRRVEHDLSQLRGENSTTEAQGHGEETGTDASSS